MIGIAALVLVPLAGCLVLRMLRTPPLRSTDLLEAIPTAFGLGAGALYLFFLMANWAGPVGLLELHGFLAALALLWFARRTRSFPPGSHRERPDRIESRDLLFLGALVAVQLSFVALTLSLPLFDWDARILWALKAKMLAADPTLAGEAFRDPYRLHIHPRYPLLVPFLSSWMARNEGAFLEWHYQVLAGTFALLTLWQLHLSLRRLADRPIALILTSVMALTGAWLGAQFGAKVEIALAFFFLLAVGRLFLWLEAGRASDVVLAGVFLCCGTMTKNEGLLLAVCTVLAFFLAVSRENGANAAIRATALLAGAFLLLSAAWFVHLARIPAVSDEQYAARLTLDVFARGLGRLPRISKAVLSGMTDLAQWHLLWLTPPFVVITLLRRRFVVDPRLSMAGILAVLYFTGLLVIYVISPWRDIVLHVDATFDRVALPLLPLFILMTALACGDGSRERRCL